MPRHAGTAEPTEYCAACDEWHTIAKPIHRRPIRRLLGKLGARAVVIRRLQVVWDMAELFLDQTATPEERWAAWDTIREAINPGPVVDLEDETEAT